MVLTSNTGPLLLPSAFLRTLVGEGFVEAWGEGGTGREVVEGVWSSEEEEASGRMSSGRV